ncbi:MAG: ParB N-terminal domain-containing protein [Patescibacteria group bacterium]|nr:ParB N-terminal domain-containing protein [Patescibacteria group bacterium]
MKTDIFHLQIIPIKNIHCHEEYDETRSKPLISKLKEKGSLVNPIIVADLGEEKYLQLDGMNRLTAFRYMGYSSICAQVIDYNEQESVDLSSWCHLFYGEQNNFLNYLKGLNGVVIREGGIENVGHRYIKENEMGRLCTVVFKNDAVFLVFAKGDLFHKIKLLNKITDFYKEKIIRDVLPLHTNEGDITILFKEHPKTNIMIVFPTFTRHQILNIIKGGELFPAGVTRHLIERRCISVNIPLSVFKLKSVNEQNEKLEQLLVNRRFRVYEEPTIFFE